MSVPNQKKIYIERSSDKAKRDFFKVSNYSLETAMYNLKNNAFKLWIYFADNANGYELDLYPVDFCLKASVSRSTYERAFNELEEKGYLKQSPKQKNVYLFTEESDKAQQPDLVNTIDSDDFENIKSEYFD